MHFHPQTDDRRPWPWPGCALCGKPVRKVDRRTQISDRVWSYAVECHGQRDEIFVSEEQFYPDEGTIGACTAFQRRYQTAA